MSRFCFYIIRFKRGIRNVFATSDISQSKNAMFKLLGDKFCHLHEVFVRQGNYSFSLPSDLQEHFIEYLNRVNEECCDEVDNKMQGVVRRMGLIAYSQLSSRLGGGIVLILGSVLFGSMIGK